jgi:hypothetical protein
LTLNIIRRLGHKLHACALMSATVTLAVMLLSGCSSSNDAGTPAQATSETASPTPAPRDPQAAEQALQAFVTAVREERLDDAWSLYAASIPGGTAEHRSDRGCDYGIFSFEFPSLRYLFQQIAPLNVVEAFGSALGTSVVELSVEGVNGVKYLATLARAEPYSQDYQVMFLNKGVPAAVPGVPDPFPSPEFPQGFCGVWTGPR